MNIPSLPTDNLYKFIALSGLVIVVFCNSFNFINANKINDDIKNLLVEIEELKFQKQMLFEKDSLINIKLNELKNKIEKYKYNIDSVPLKIEISDLKESLLDSKHREYLTFIYTYYDEIFPEVTIRNNIDQLIKDSDNNLLLIRQKENSILIKNKILKMNEVYVNKLKWLMVIGSFIGAGLTFTGFRLWYKKVQIFLDKSIENESKKA